MSEFLTSAVAFDHGCAQDGIVVLRKAGAQADLDVCGTVRRYKMVFDGESSQTWVDVTALYPPASLPAPRAESPREAAQGAPSTLRDERPGRP